MNKLLPQLKRAKIAAKSVNVLSHATRQRALKYLATELREQATSILRANSKDAAALDLNDPMRDRLLLSVERIEGMAQEIEGLVDLPDPIGKTYNHRTRHGLKLYRQRVPLGVIGIVYESRPNVTTDVTGICLKSGNAVILKGGKEAKYSYTALMKVIHAALTKAGITKDAVQMVDPTNRALVTDLITADGYLDLVIPRGSQRLINFVRTTATVPVIETGAGVCHTFVDATANLKKSAVVVFNAKTQRPSVCNALDTLLIHKKIAKKFLPQVAELLQTKHVEIYADSGSYAILKTCYPSKLLKKAKTTDFGREFLSQSMSVKIVGNIEQAIEHINTYSSKHSEAILTESKTNTNLFQTLVDAAVVYTNASTRFSDGSMFGLGSEIGNSTQKIHARGPMGPAEMTTYKWIVAGKYTPRP
ncbi:MAG: glutamate-5-semialdehyde dehydrogenase [Candidatus Kerfeldbacteria bacterium CG15_BIG_FIL_POST_REV_8_21_14_020_45_12]|uniref:Gamma-glutamyl phosphate reductase n=1 Tax=Candidatus Kerfeldbacteria bacterium CG15_BIG_FIL_POST_REV_8_21_14_020_45_12 TaxID=2014247 RepID=A0A2M7H337_9BACT|nr:MAG: glutamate-5-semialdehyde dehydrogenase [Candidatus Kerfeldbacteria bacterium CG15_BIG_FIL_POST_REV_8_21_14_020_45_12]PJA93299.1 MAG: glutamate-5-semialdehyde dehydrogenase [Candidatus Kerfeldbacteria bacterium CG_4_9_14_3_um_filter_45_8]